MPLAVQCSASGLKEWEANDVTTMSRRMRDNDSDRTSLSSSSVGVGFTSGALLFLRTISFLLSLFFAEFFSLLLNTKALHFIIACCFKNG